MCRLCYIEIEWAHVDIFGNNLYSSRKKCPATTLTYGTMIVIIKL